MATQSFAQSLTQNLKKSNAAAFQSVYINYRFALSSIYYTLGNSNQYMYNDEIDYNIDACLVDDVNGHLAFSPPDLRPVFSSLLCCWVVRRGHQVRSVWPGPLHFQRRAVGMLAVPGRYIQRRIRPEGVQVMHLAVVQCLRRADRVLCSQSSGYQCCLGHHYGLLCIALFLRNR